MNGPGTPQFVDSRNPYTGEVLGRVPFATKDEVKAALGKAVEAFGRWRQSPAWERAQLLNTVASHLEARRDEFASLLRAEAGKPIDLAQAEVDRALGVLRWAAAEAQRFGGELLRTDVSPTGRAGFGIHQRFPRGVILGITPFNFPLNLVLHKVAPAVACGCSIIIKPSPATPLTAIRIRDLFETHAPGLVQVVMADDASTAELTRAREVAMVSFTGSARVGWLIRQQAPEKPTALELGGNAWVIVFPDTPEAALPAIAKRIATAAFAYSGQSCISVQNVAVARDLWPGFQSALAVATEETRFGDPASKGVVSGPQIHQAAADRIRAALAQAPADVQLVQARNRAGEGTLPRSVVAPSLLMMPTSAPEAAMPAGLVPLVQEEIFGPVMVARSFEAVDEVIAKVNGSRYGLQAGIYTQHWPTIEKLYRELEVGGVVINDVPTTRYDHQPYGGVKESGQGREGVRYAMEEMTESKFLSLSSVIPGAPSPSS